MAIFSVSIRVGARVTELIPHRALIRLWQVVRHFLARGELLRIALGYLDAVAEAGIIIGQHVVGIGRACIQGTASAFRDLCPGLSSYAL
jgi:hypothetical protein